MPLKTRLFLLTLILLLGAAGRILHMHDQSLWTDEGFSYYVTQQADIMPVLFSDVHPPLYFTLLKLWVGAAGVSELSLRFMSFLPSLLSIAVVYQLARELMRHRGREDAPVVPVLAALMMALADAENYLSQEARMYTLHTFFAALSMWGFLRWSRQPGRLWAGLWVVSTALLVYTHYLGVWTPLVEGLYVLLVFRGRKRLEAMGLLALSGLLFLPWLAGVGIAQLGNGGGYNRADPSDIYALIDYFYKWFSQQWPLMLGLALIGTVTLVYGERLRVRWRPFSPSLLLAAWIILPVALTFVANFWLPVLAAHRVSQITPAVALLFAFGLANFRSPARIFLIAVIVVYGVTTVDFYRPKEPWRQYAASLARYFRPGDLALMEIGGGDYQVGYYLDHMLPPESEIVSLKLWRQDNPGSYPTGLPALLSVHKTAWLAYWSPETQVFDQLKAAGYVITAKMTTDHWGNPLDVYRFDVLPDEPAAVYANGVVLRQAAVYPDVLRVDLWWSLDEDTPKLDADYTTSAFLLDETGKLVAQYDSFPFNGARPTSAWNPGDVVYDPKPLALVGVTELPPGRYAVGVQMYRWQDGVKVPTLAGEPWATVGTMDIR